MHEIVPVRGPVRTGLNCLVKLRVFGLDHWSQSLVWADPGQTAPEF